MTDTNDSTMTPAERAAKAKRAGFAAFHLAKPGNGFAGVECTSRRSGGMLGGDLKAYHAALAEPMNLCCARCYPAYVRRTERVNRERAKVGKAPIAIRPFTA